MRAVEGPTIRLSRTDAAERYLDQLRPRFLECGYDWQAGVASEHLEALAVAELRRTRLVAFNIAQVVFVFAQIEPLSQPLLDEYVACCARFARSERPTPPGQGCVLIPVALAADVTPGARTALLERRPLVPKISRSIVPAAYDLAERALLCSGRGRALHAVAWRPIYQIIQTMLVP